MSKTAHTEKIKDWWNFPFLTGSYFLILWFIFSSNSLHAQNKQLIDSLTQVLEGDLSPTERVDLYVNIAEEYAKSDSINTIKFANKAMDLAKEIKYQDGVIEALISLGTLAIEKGHYENAMTQFEEIVTMAEEANYPPGKAKAYRGIATLYDYGGKYVEALDYFNKSLALFENAGNEAEVALNLSFISGVKRMQGDYSMALEIGLKSMSIYEKLGDIPGLGLCLNDVGLIYWNLGELDKAIEYFGKSIDIHMELEDRRSIAYTTANIGMIYEEKKEPADAMNSYKKSLEILYELNDKRALSIVLYNISVVYKDLKAYDLSLEHGFKSLKIRDELGVESEKSYPLVGVGRTYMNMENFEQAAHYLNLGAQTAAKFGLKRVEMEALASLAFVENKRGHYKKAYDHHVRFKNITDSLRNEENTKKIARLEAEYEFEQEKDSLQNVNEREILAKNNQIALEKVRFNWTVGIGILILMIGVIIAWMRIRVKTQKAKYLEEISQFKEAMTVMIAHDLKNPLGVIMNTSSEKPSIKFMARQMLNLVNNMLDVQKFEKTELELDMSDLSLPQLIADALEQVRPLLSEKNININTEGIEQLSVRADHEMLSRVFVNFLTNAIKYSSNNAQINILTSQQESKVQIAIADQGAGIPADQIDGIFDSYGQVAARKSGGVASTGLGLTFCKLALEAHDTQIQVQSKVGQGTTFSFELEIAKPMTSGEEISKDTRTFIISQSDRKSIISRLPQLRALNVHEAIEIETILDEVKEQTSKDTASWVDSVLDAAYAGNQEYYEELLRQAEQSAN